MSSGKYALCLIKRNFYTLKTVKASGKQKNFDSQKISTLRCLKVLGAFTLFLPLYARSSFMKPIITFVALTGLFLSCRSYSQDFSSRFRDLHDKSDTSGMRTLLLQWQKEKENDPGRYIACYEYHRWKSGLGMVERICDTL